MVPYNRFTGEGNGFSFSNYNAHEMLDIIRYAAEVHADKKAWKTLVKNAMATDNGWSASADKYIALYEETCEK